MSFLLLTYYTYFLLPTEVVVTSGSINKATLSIPKVGTVVDFSADCLCKYIITEHLKLLLQLNTKERLYFIKLILPTQ